MKWKMKNGQQKDTKLRIFYKFWKYKALGGLVCIFQCVDSNFQILMSANLLKASCHVNASYRSDNSILRIDTLANSNGNGLRTVKSLMWARLERVLLIINVISLKSIEKKSLSF